MFLREGIGKRGSNGRRNGQVSAIVRLNNKEYDRQDFIKTGFNHYDLFFEDCTTPNEAIVKV